MCFLTNQQFLCKYSWHRNYFGVRVLAASAAQQILWLVEDIEKYAHSLCFPITTAVAQHETSIRKTLASVDNLCRFISLSIKWKMNQIWRYIVHVFRTPLLEFIFSSEHMCVSNEMQDMLENYKLVMNFHFYGELNFNQWKTKAFRSHYSKFQ